MKQGLNTNISKFSKTKIMRNGLQCKSRNIVANLVRARKQQQNSCHLFHPKSFNIHTWTSAQTQGTNIVRSKLWTQLDWKYEPAEGPCRAVRGQCRKCRRIGESSPDPIVRHTNAQNRQPQNKLIYLILDRMCFFERNSLYLIHNVRIALWGKPKKR